MDSWVTLKRDDIWSDKAQIIKFVDYSSTCIDIVTICQTFYCQNLNMDPRLPKNCGIYNYKFFNWFFVIFIILIVSNQYERSKLLLFYYIKNIIIYVTY